MQKDSGNARIGATIQPTGYIVLQDPSLECNCCFKDLPFIASHRICFRSFLPMALRALVMPMTAADAKAVLKSLGSDKISRVAWVKLTAEFSSSRAVKVPERTIILIC